MPDSIQKAGDGPGKNIQFNQILYNILAVVLSVFVLSNFEGGKARLHQNATLLMHSLACQCPTEFAKVWFFSS